MEFMHSENLVHRNLKAENILIFDIERYTRVGNEKDAKIKNFR